MTLKNFLGEKSQENGPVCRKKERKKTKEKSNGNRQKNKRGDSKVESYNNPEIPDCRNRRRLTQQGGGG